jgi:hypothetical protein
MNEALARDLYLKYPKILTQDGVEVYLDVDDGWYDILDSLCNQIQDHIDWKNGEGEYAKYKTNPNRKEDFPVPQLVAEQIKEKFSTLRFYAYGGDEKIAGMIAMAECFTARVCEVCGSPGKRTKGGWIKTLCKKHAEEQGREFDDGKEEDR